MARFPIAVEKLEDVAEAFRENYVKGPDGKYYPDLDVEALPTVQGLATTLKKFKEIAPDATKLAERVAKLKDLEALDPAEYKRLKDAEAERKEKGDNLELLQREHAKKLEEIQTDAQKRILAAEEAGKKAQDAARDYFIESSLTAAITKAEGHPHMLLHELRGKVRADTDDKGTFKLVVLGPGGEQRIKDSAGNVATVDDLVGEYRTNKDWGGAFKPSGSTGSGSTGGGGGGGGGGGVVSKETLMGGSFDLEALAAGKTKVVD